MRALSPRPQPCGYLEGSLAIDKRKTLESARKYAQRGAREKSLAQYEALLRADPRDFKLRLEIGDAHQRWGRSEEAITHYTRVAEQFCREGFEARAVAVWKRVLNLDAKRTEPHVALSDLYQHLGMQSQSIESLQAGIDGLYRDGQKREALELLRRMGELDPTNTTSRLKVAALLFREGMKIDAVKEYEQVATEFERIEALEAIPGVYERILEVSPGCSEIRLKLGQARFRVDELASAETVLKEISAAEPGYEQANQLLGEIYESQGRLAQVSEVRRRLASLYRKRGDDDQAREMIQRLPAGEGPGRGAEFAATPKWGGLDFGADDIESLDFGDPSAPEEEDFLEVDDAGPEDPDVSNFDFGWPSEGAEEGRRCDPVAVTEEASPTVLDEPGFNGGANPVPNPSVEDGDCSGIEFEIEPEGFGGREDPESPSDTYGTGTPSLLAGEDDTGSSRDTSPLASIVEDLEEASFYAQQDLYDEAEAILQRVLVRAPGHPTALVRLGEIAAARGEDPGRAGEPVVDIEHSGEALVADDNGIADGSFDFASELREELETEVPASSELRGRGREEVQSAVEGGMAEIFADFKRGVAETLSAADIETRYDLGIAYREMGLFEDAIEEFRACLEFVERRVDSLHMLALCCVDAGRPRDAVAYLEQALAGPGLSDERREGLSFELARVCERLGDVGRARSVYEAIRNADYPGLAERLAALDAVETRGGSVDLLPVETESAGGYESFDDLVIECEAGALAEREPSEVEDRGESWASGDVVPDAEGVRRRRARKISFV